MDEGGMEDNEFFSSTHPPSPIPHPPSPILLHPFPFKSEITSTFIRFKMECCCCFSTEGKFYSCARCKTVSCAECLILNSDSLKVFPRCLGERCGERIGIYFVITLLSSEFFKKKALNYLVNERIEDEKSKVSDVRKAIEDFSLNVELSKRIQEINYHLISKRPRPSKEEEEELKEELEELIQKQNSLLNGWTDDTTETINCPTPECSGILKKGGECSACRITRCLVCLSIKGEDHQCKKEDLEAIEYLKNNFKKCPRCKIPIEKKSGCDHMFCIRCLTAFNWGDLKITNNYSNPHYYEMLTSGRIPDEINIHRIRANRIGERDCEVFEFNTSYMLKQKCIVDKIDFYLRDTFNIWDPSKERKESIKIYGLHLTNRITEAKMKKSFESMIRKKIFLTEIRDIYLAISNFFKAIWSMEEMEAIVVWKKFKNDIRPYLESIEQSFNFGVIDIFDTI